MPHAHDFTFEGIAGGALPLSQFKGRAILIVNVASRCGLTPQYEGLVELYRTFRDRGLVVLGVPSNQFMGQEPGTDAEIQAFCSTTYGVDFPLASKTDVKDDGAHPFYKWAAGELGPAAVPAWNFHKLLIGKDGRALQAFAPTTRPDDPGLRRAIEEAL